MIEKKDLNYSNSCKVVCRLERSTTPLISKVEVDEGTNLANVHFDFDFNGENVFYPFKLPKALEDLDFQILVITGASGAGKSVFSRYFGQEEKIVWDNNKAIISNFESPEDAVDKLNAVGLCSIPSWTKPYKVLSVGEAFRADLARRLKDNCVIDEFTSTVDRNVALSCASSIKKYIKAKNLKRCVFVSCHKDFIDVLCPDYVIDLDDECMYDTRGLERRRFQLSIYERQDKREIWNIFKKHHYLSADLNVASKMYVAYLDDQIVAMCAMIGHPDIKGRSFRVHRLVVLPDYQGLGIGIKFLYEIAKMYAKAGCNFYIRTSHIKLVHHMQNHSESWVQTMRSGTQCPQNNWSWHIINNRFPYSFKFIGDCSDGAVNPNLVLIKEKENFKPTKSNLFDVTPDNVLSKFDLEAHNKSLFEDD